jgi:ubiquinol-cytochrome c reductase cytochrome c1 subunit
MKIRGKSMKKLLTLSVRAAACCCQRPRTAPGQGSGVHRSGCAANGAKLFVNYCLNCHGASYMRYNRLQQIGLSEQMIKDNLMFTADKIGEPMRIAMQRDEAKVWFGAAPPDLTVIARSRASEFGSGADWLYTYLRGFYRDSERPTGWNNVIFENVGMPHVLYELQGEQVAKVTERTTATAARSRPSRSSRASPARCPRKSTTRRPPISSPTWSGWVSRWPKPARRSALSCWPSLVFSSSFPIF